MPRLATVFSILGIAALSAAQAGMPYPDAAAPNAIDLGALDAQAGSAPLALTIALRLNNVAAAESLLTSIDTPGSAQFHQFLTAAQFAARFAPADSDIAKISGSLAAYGLAVQRTTATTLRVSGSAANVERAFGVTLHGYEVPARGSTPGYTYHAPLTAPTIPAEIAPWVAAVAGLDTRPPFHPHARSALSPLAAVPPAGSSGGQGDAPGYYTVKDFASDYDVQPLYQQGISGAGSSLAIVTLANFTPSDAFDYWSALGLNVSRKRLSVVNIDGGPGAPSDASGSLETTLDVEQSGGVAPGADITVYMAPNTFQGFLDAFAAAVDGNVADSISTSWGLWEWFANLENGPVTDPASGETVGFSEATHELLVRAAIQGQATFAAASDGGAYDAFDSGYGPPAFSLVLSVDYPGSDSAITAGGGTTLASIQEFSITGMTQPLIIRIPHERVWGWDWLQPLCDALGTPNPLTCGIFGVGSGGGVSIVFPQPLYQYGIAGMQRSEPGQDFIQEQPPPPQLIYALPAYYPGRNVPDISFDADPYTGYVVYYTSSQTGFGIEPGWGGTSFVAPQLNGVAALFKQYLHGRVGLLNAPLYDLLSSGQAYRSLEGGAPINAIPYGDNWFYQGSNGYNQGVGAGTMNVANFAQALRKQLP